MFQLSKNIFIATYPANQVIAKVNKHALLHKYLQNALNVVILP